MKTVLFAIAMEKFAYTAAEQFENKVVEILRTGSREFADTTSFHCDYKEGIEKMCKQYHPDCLVVNEALLGIGNIYDIVRELKSEYPEMLIVMLIKEQRAVGDAILANLVTAGIYNWIVAPWKPEAVANALIAPKKFKDVEMYVPKIIEGPNGLAFEPKVIERVEDKIEDLPDMLETPTNNALKLNGKVDDIGKSEEHKSASYSRKIAGGFNFGKSFRPIAKEAKENIEVFEEPIVEESPVTVVEEPIVEKEVIEAPVATIESEPIKETPKSKELKEKKPNIFDYIEKSFNEAKKESQEKIESKEEKVENFVKVLEGTKRDTLASIKFHSKYNKILFIRALPIASIVPVHICKMMKAAFVDFNKKTYNNEFFDILQTTIKEAKMPESEFVVGDVVAGNGIEKLVDKFDHVVAILPEDPFAIKEFVNRYDGLFKGVLIDKATASSLTRKQLLSLIPNAEYIDTMKVDKCNKEVIQSLLNHELLMDNPEVAEGMKFFLKDVGNLGGE